MMKAQVRDSAVKMERNQPNWDILHDALNKFRDQLKESVYLFLVEGGIPPVK